MLTRTFDEIELALKNGLYTLALGMTVCIPDICAGLESEDGKTSGAKYKDWYDRYLGDVMFLNGSDCYYFRCSFLHQGNTIHEKSKFDRIIFIAPNDKMSLHNNNLNGVLNIDLEIFCDEVISGAKRWLEDVDSSEVFQSNYKTSFRIHPNGIPPYIVGVPVFG